jgi:UDP-N-acetylglucosamine 4,6-dehydratase
MVIFEKFKDFSFFEKKNILITGGTGTLGNKLVEFFLNSTDSNKICIFSRDEFKQSVMRNKFKDNPKNEKLRFFIGDIRDSERLKISLENIDIVFHAAAMKQIDTIEYNPCEAIKTNIIGTENIISACLYNKVEMLIGISTDKACSPNNVYGSTKFILEKLITNTYMNSGKKLKTCVLRYGNVVGSRGSVIPVFKNQINNSHFTVTDKDMTRFTIDINQALNFILNCTVLAKGGETFIPKLPKYEILQLCNLIDPKKEIKIIGMRYGEKLHEEMISESESLNVYETEDFFVVQPYFGLDHKFIDQNKLTKCDKIFSYNSNNAEKIKNHIMIKYIQNDSYN